MPWSLGFCRKNIELRAKSLSKINYVFYGGSGVLCTNDSVKLKMMKFWMGKPWRAPEEKYGLLSKVL